jgi:hypothetical protein
MTHLLVTLCVLLLLNAGSSMADVLAVPADHPTIEAAIDAAEDGDEILVAPGVWYENLFVRKQVTITGSGQGVTIIDGSQPAMFSFGSCVVVSGGFSKSNEPVRLQSLTLRNGFGAEIYGVVRGGGIYSEFAKVELNQVTIEDCNVLPQNESDSMGWGGAICNYGGAYVINDSTLRNNSSFSHGGAIFMYGSLVLNNTLITNNIADLAGGAIYANSPGTELECFDSSICDNQSMFGGALALEQIGRLRLERCRLNGNVAQDGAALYMDETLSVIRESSFEHNVAETDATVIRIFEQPRVPGVLFMDVSGSLFCGADQGDWREFIQESGPNDFLETCGPAGDLNHDGVISGDDLSILLSQWGRDGSETNADLDCDGMVSGSDLTMLMANWPSS